MPLALIKADGQVVDASKALFFFFECAKDEQIDNIALVVGALSSNFKKNLKKQKQFTETIEVVSRKGNLRWIRAMIYPYSKKEGLFQVSFDDVTTSKIQYDLALQAKKIAKVGSWTVDLVNNKVFWSNETKVIHGLPADFVPDLERGINFYKEGESRERIIGAVSECIESGNPFDLELIIITAKGKEKWVRSIGAAERINGKTISLSGVFQDIDKAKRQRLKYEVLNDRLRAAVNSANVGVWDYNIINNTLFWDDKMYDLYGVKKSDFKGVYDAWERTIHPEDKEYAANEVALAIKGEKEFNTEFRIIKQDGSIAFIHAEAKVFYNKQGKPHRLIGANTDITRVKRKDERLRKLLNVTEKQNQRLLDFTNIVSHNLRSNSSNISMLAGMLNSGLPAIERKKFIEMIQVSSEQLDETIVQLNEIVKIRTNYKVEIQQIPIKLIIDKVIESVNGLVLESDAQIKVEFNNQLKVNGVKPYLTSIFLNLMTNSLKYRDHKRELQIDITAKVLQNQTIISFSDNGLGIDLNRHGQKIFGMYKTFHNNKDAKGVGLFITKNHMEAMNGKIEVESKINEGTTFHLYFMNN